MMIYCVEDDAAIRNMIIYTLNASGFEAFGFSDGEEFFEALAKKRPALVMLDIMLSGESGIEILEKLKSNSATQNIPVIMATAKGTEFDKVTGLDLGADDYLAKPFGMMEMVSRVKAVLRRSGAPRGNEKLTAGNIVMDVRQHTVFVGERQVLLTLKEFKLLRLFMENQGTVFTRDDLLLKIWATDYVGESRTVDVHMGTLRTKLLDAGESIKTVRGVGYRMEVQS